MTKSELLWHKSLFWLISTFYDNFNFINFIIMIYQSMFYFLAEMGFCRRVRWIFSQVCFSDVRQYLNEQNELLTVNLQLCDSTGIMKSLNRHQRVWERFIEYDFICSTFRGFASVPSAVVPVQKQQRERAHDQEEENPHAEAGVILDGLRNTRRIMILWGRLDRHK